MGMADILLSGWVALKGTSIIAKEKERELSKVFSRYFIERAKELDKYCLIGEEAHIAMESGAAAVMETGEGGIYGSLWEMAARLEVGIDVYLKDIPIKQETIEIANHFDLNPYLLLSRGALLMVTDKGYDLMRNLKEKGIGTAIIGRTTESNDRVIINGDRRSFLSPRYRDELFKLWPENPSGLHMFYSI